MIRLHGMWEESQAHLRAREQDVADLMAAYQDDISEVKVVPVPPLVIVIVFLCLFCCG